MPALPDWINRETVLLAGLGLAILIHGTCLVYYARTGALIRVTDLLTGDNGRLASSKTFQAWAFVLSAWAMVWFTVTGHSDPMGWSAWVAIWAGAAIGNKVVIQAETRAKHDAAPQPPAPPA